MQKYINLDLSIYELVEKYPELISIMKELGFTDITKQVMLHSVGKIMTIPKGAKMKNIPMDEIVIALKKNGFTVSTLDDSNKQQIKETISQSGDSKEANILFPNCASNFTEQEWIGIYHDEKDYAVCFDVEPENWKMAEEKKKTKPSSYADHEIVMPGGHMNVEQLTALLNTIPLEITFVDAENINRFFNEGPKDFKRPGMAIRQLQLFMERVVQLEHYSMFLMVYPMPCYSRNV